MKYVSYTIKGKKSLGVIINNNVIDIYIASNKKIPNDMSIFLKDCSKFI